ncbi:hypothetical protein C3486_36585 [Streptomyces sp. Ru73]|uniref:acyl-CoA carboxylase epsilon subunit n=1 Tax=Streptomyces sp. Ru73 TaxID=2080748 RepID=UPI000CDE413F|nr:acyl-CoA carboxylase epsilon subunit [Streptomyces sp. Ru73]POX35878.1 hypothetical protein C3486_36585 [Streptomyces sp. Ru73]
MIKVVRGNPTPEELAAALAVVRARAAVAAHTAPTDAPGPRDSWSDPTRLGSHRLPAPGPTAWARTYWRG